MKVGILTFHWATNYGAILQAYALQKYLVERGHEVEIINYKPKQYDFSLLKFLKHPRLILNLRKEFNNIIKEKKLKLFRLKYLHLTKRVYTQEEVMHIVCRYDLLISGSDQILNPSFTMNGEGHETSVYYLDFPDTKCKKIGYAVSFGCKQYPANVESVAKKYIQAFDKIGVREDTGMNILSQLSFNKEAMVTPDPTILMGTSLFTNISFVKKWSSCNDYVCVYMLRRKLEEQVNNAIFIDEKHQSYSMEEWLSIIRYSKMLITNSYHGMIVAILFHVPFVIDIEIKKDIGMNDRFYTLLSRLELTHRIVNNNFKEVFYNTDINWNDIDARMALYRKEGDFFLKFN